MVCIVIRPRPTNPRGQHGSALIAVLWVALLLSSLTAGMLAVARTEVRAAHGRAETFKAQMAARSGLEIAAYLTATGAVNNVSALSQYAPDELNGYVVSFERSLESQKLDINLASEQVFQQLFVFLDMDPASAQGLAARIADWRDGDDLARPNGAEARDYAGARNGERIGDRPFHSPKELLQVLDFPADLYECIAPVVTVFGASATPARALMVELFGDAPFADQANSAQRRLSTSSRARSGGARFAVTARVSAEAAEDLRLNGLYRVTGNPGAPYESIIIYTDRHLQNVGQAECLLS